MNWSNREISDSFFYVTEFFVSHFYIQEEEKEKKT